MLPDNSADVYLHLNKHRKKYLTIALIAVVAFIAIVIAVKLPSSPIYKIYTKKPKVEIKTSYKNPFDKNTQYVNPFDKYKNPFVTNR